METRQHNLIARHRHIDGDGERFEKRFKGEVNVPGPTPQEVALQDEQLNLLRQQRAESDMYKPILYAQNNLIEEKDPVTGKIGLRKMTEDEILANMTSADKGLYDIQKLQADRLKKAYEGTLPVSEALESDISKRRQTLEETMGQKLGANWKLSTPGLQALAEFNKGADQLREQSRKGEIDSGTGLMLNQMGYLGDTRQQNFNRAANFNAGGNALFNQYSTAMQPYQMQRQMELQANMQNAKNSGGLMSGIGGVLGAGMGALGTYYGLGGLGKMGGVSMAGSGLSGGGGGGGYFLSSPTINGFLGR